jgi:hypothetical protein
MCICTRFTWATEFAALPNNRTKANIAIEVLRLILSPDVFAVMNPYMCGFWNEVRAHESHLCLPVDTLRPGLTKSGVRDVECTWGWIRENGLAANHDFEMQTGKTVQE